VNVNSGFLRELYTRAETKAKTTHLTQTAKEGLLQAEESYVQLEKRRNPNQRKRAKILVTGRSECPAPEQQIHLYIQQQENDHQFAGINKGV